MPSRSVRNSSHSSAIPPAKPITTLTANCASLLPRWPWVHDAVERQDRRPGRSVTPPDQDSLQPFGRAEKALQRTYHRRPGDGEDYSDHHRCAW